MKLSCELSILLISSICLLHRPVMAQGEPSKTGTIAGYVLEGDDGVPMKSAIVTLLLGSKMSSGAIVRGDESKSFDAKTDSEGRYRISDVPTGTSVLNVSAEGARFESRQVYIKAAPAVTEVSVRFVPRGIIRGSVLDAAKMPVKGSRVFLLAQEFRGGGVHDVVKGMAISKSTGAFELLNVEPSRQYRLMAQPPPSDIQAAATSATKYGKGTPSLSAAWYPNSNWAGGAATIQVRPREVRDGADIQLTTVPTYCLSGTASGVSLGSSSKLSIENRAISTGPSVAIKPIEFALPSTGAFRLCNFTPSDYRLTIVASVPDGGQEGFGWRDVTISKEDVEGVLIIAGPPIEVRVETTWEKEVPKNSQIPGRVALRMLPITRISHPSEEPFATVDIPSRTPLRQFPDQFTLTALSRSPEIYVKDIVYNYKSVLYGSISLAAGMDTPTVTVIMARDAGSLDVSVKDDRGNALSGVRVAVMPAESDSDIVLAGSLRLGTTNEHGKWTGQGFAPGKYFVLATDRVLDASPDLITTLRQARISASSPVDVPSLGTVSISIIARSL